MGLLIVDESKCKKDGLCAKECPMAIIRQKDKESCPELAPGGEQLCNLCGHCVAICPHGALSHTLVPLAECPPLQKDLIINKEQAVQFLRSRRSIRFFEDRPVEKETIRELIETARYAPSANNAQLVEWQVFTGKNKIKELAGMTVEWMRSVLRKDPQPVYAPYLPMIVAAWDGGYDVVLREAPALIVASAPKQDSSGMVDVTLALSYLELAATAMGLGTCWAGLVQGAMLSSPQVKKEMGISESHSRSASGRESGLLLRENGSPIKAFGDDEKLPVNTIKRPVIDVP
jgi:nitroreductase/NAD-dependent dihydropyrimidine dehydrogenase PreA subunit